MLEAHDLDFSYTPATPLLKGWTETFRSGEMTAITGPSGRGKSTLLYLLGLMVAPRSGEILLDGEPVHEMSNAQRAYLRASRFGFVFQDAVLDSTRTVLENVTEASLYRGRQRSDERSRGIELLREFEVDLRADAKPGQVSGGQAQRIALCRALIHDPTVILADEPTGNLDGLTANVVISALRQRARDGSVVVIVTHDHRVTEECDREVKL